MTSTIPTNYGDLTVWTTDDPQSLPAASAAMQTSVANALNGILGRYTTAALLLAASPANAGFYLADNALGAQFWWSGSGWTMYGVPRFATAAARNSALTAPAAGWLSRIDTDSFVRRATGSGTTWAPYGAASYPFLPTSVTNGTAVAPGTVTFSGVSSVTLQTAFPSDWTRFKFDFNITTSVAGTDIIPAFVGSATGYDRSFGGNVNASFGGGTALNQAGWGLIAVGGATINSGSFEVYEPNLAVQTTGMAQAGSTGNPMVAANSGYRTQFWLHRPTTAYSDLTLSVASGTMTGYIRPIGLSL